MLDAEPSCALPGEVVIVPEAMGCGARRSPDGRRCPATLRESPATCGDSRRLEATTWRPYRCGRSLRSEPTDQTRVQGSEHRLRTACQFPSVPRSSAVKLASRIGRRHRRIRVVFLSGEPAFAGTLFYALRTQDRRKRTGAGRRGWPSSTCAQCSPLSAARSQYRLTHSRCQRPGDVIRTRENSSANPLRAPTAA